MQETGEIIPVPAGGTILEAGERAGLALPHDCREGWCGTCRIRLLEGEVIYEEPPVALTQEEMEAGYALACQGRPAGDLLISVPASPALPEPQRYLAVLRGVRPVTPDVFHVTVEFPAGATSDFLPGQYMNIILDDGDVRSFSMASVPGADILDFYLRRITGGRFTDSHLESLRTGDALQVELPLGSFFYHAEDDRPLLMIATGTGLAPIKAMLESLMETPSCPPVTLYWGMRKQEDLFLDRELRSLANHFPEFSYRPVLSRPEPGWDGRRGYVQDAAIADLADLSGFSIYLCGSPRMIADTKSCFLTRGASPMHVYSEGFTVQGSTLGSFGT
ncbi:MAG TPA: 2Fe-2S iron-sulfur cluster-binding protein [Acidiphilium sp.]